MDTMSPFSVNHIDTVVFDVIGTLVDEDAAWASASERIAALAGVKSASDLRHTWMRLLDDRMSAVVAGRARGIRTSSWSPIRPRMRSRRWAES